MNLTHEFEYFINDDVRIEVDLTVDYNGEEITEVVSLVETTIEEGKPTTKILSVEAWDALGIVDLLIEKVDWFNKYIEEKEEVRNG